MPSEPDNKIEGLLKTYAKKRREEAGAPFELHPATRRLLQTEVARQRPKAPEPPPSFFRLLMTFWPRLAAGVGVVALLAVAIWLATPRPEATRQLARNAGEVRQDFYRAEDRLSKDAKSEAASKTPAPALTPSAAPEGLVRETLLARQNALATDAPAQGANEPKVQGMPGATPLYVTPSREASQLSKDRGVAGGGFGGGLGGAGGFGGKGAADRRDLNLLADGRAGAPGVPNPNWALESRRFQAPLSGETLSGSKPTATAKGLDSLGYEVASNTGPAPEAAKSASQREYFYSFGLIPTNSPRDRFGEQEVLGAVLATTAPTNGTTFGREAGKVALLSYGDRSGTGNGTPAAPAPAVPELQVQLRRGDASSPAETGKKLLADSAFKDTLAQNLEAPKASPPNVAFSADLDAVQIQNADQLAAGAEKLAKAKTDAGALGNRLGRGEALAASANGRARFAQTAQASAALGLQFRASPNLLNSFELEQTGNRVRLFDADGSVYEGQVGAIGALAATLDDTLREVDKTERTTGPVELKQKTAERQPAQPAGSAPAGEGIPFQATGTNRSLNQLVVINGTLIAGSEVANNINAIELDSELAPKPSPSRPTANETSPTTAPTAPTAPPAGSEPSSAGRPVFRSRAVAPAAKPAETSGVTRGLTEERLGEIATQVVRIRGSARIGGTSEVRIDAVRRPN